MKTIAAIVIVIIVVVAAVAYYLTMMPSAPTTTTGQVKIAMILPGRTDDLAWNQAGYNSFTDLLTGYGEGITRADAGYRTTWRRRRSKQMSVTS